jgi:uncharacterized protein (TIGR04222 family)
MEDTWGIPGPTFVGIYLLALLIALLFAFAVRILTRVGADSTAVPAQELSAQELACLTGGPRRVVEAAIAQLVDNGQMRASRDGYLQATGREEGDDPVERTVLAEVKRHGRRSVHLVVDRLGGSDAVEEVESRLVRNGYLVDRGFAERRKVLGLVPVVAVFAVGLVRWLTGVANGRPIAMLTLLLIGTGVILYVMRRQTVCSRTFRGTTVVGTVNAVTPAESVAAGGFGRHPDKAIRQSFGAQNHSAAAWIAGGAVAGGGYGSHAGDGGGSSCGGGGCGS